MPADIRHLRALYAGTDDPWHFRTSAYEAAKFDVTVATLPRSRYVHALELGCGNGELARRVAPRCAAYTGLDAVEAPLAAARRALPRGRFVRGFLPCPLPAGTYDLVVLSEILYFLDPSGLNALARSVDAAAPRADVIAVTWCGVSGNALQGEAALDLYAAATDRARMPAARTHADYRIDLFAPVASATLP